MLRDALEKLPVSIDGNDLDGGIVLQAELESVAGLLRDVVEEWGDDPSGWPSSSSSVIPAAGRSEETPLHTKERESLLKLVIGMAVDGYGYDPSKAKSPVPGEIASELHKLDLSLSVSGRFEPRSM